VEDLRDKKDFCKSFLSLKVPFFQTKISTVF
jgi:hypothetical protein